LYAVNEITSLYRQHKTSVTAKVNVQTVQRSRLILDNSPSQRLDVKEAAEYLGISVDAVRKRLQRGQLESEKDDSGRVWVWLDSGQDADKDIRQTEHLAILEAKDETIQELRNEVELLRQELERRGEETIRKDHIIMSLTQRIPAIEAPAADSTQQPEPRESAVSDSETEAKGDILSATERQPWWRRIFR
jgi:excisionase family DNA binding protein